MYNCIPESLYELEWQALHTPRLQIHRKGLAEPYDRPLVKSLRFPMEGCPTYAAGGVALNTAAHAVEDSLLHARTLVHDCFCRGDLVGLEELLKDTRAIRAKWSVAQD